MDLRSVGQSFREVELNVSIGMRELITVAAGGACLRGTYHKPLGDRPDSGTNTGEGDRIGVVFLNPGFLPRSGHADSAVYWADSFAKSGYPSFRFDLPALGDAEGSFPPRMLDFVNTGGYAPIVSAAVKILAARFKLAGVVMIGLCAGSVTALFTAAASQECRGLVLMDPYFFRPEERTKLRVGLSRWASWSRLGGFASNLYDRLRYITLLFQKNRPPRNANFPLLRCWKQLASNGTPILVLKAPGFKAPDLKPRVGDFDYLGYLQGLSGRGSRVDVELIPGTNHSFGDGVGRAAVRQHAEQWLNAYFPLRVREDAAEQNLVNNRR